MKRSFSPRVRRIGLVLLVLAALTTVAAILATDSVLGSHSGPYQLSGEHAAIIFTLWLTSGVCWLVGLFLSSLAAKILTSIYGGRFRGPEIVDHGDHDGG